MHGLDLQPNWERLSLEEVFSILDQKTILPSVETYIHILHKCRKNKSLQHAKRVHAHLSGNGLESHRVIGNHIVPMYVECGSVADAQHAFDRLQSRNEHSWTSLISGYIHCGKSEHAFNLYQKMQADRVHPSRYTFMALLKACTNLKDAKKGREIHSEVLENGLDTDCWIGNILIDMYAKCGSLSEAQAAFDNMQIRDVVSWTTLISRYAEQGQGQQALELFEKMQQKGISPNQVTYISALKACSNIGAIERGREIHREIRQTKFQSDSFVGNSLIDMYAKYGFFSEARGVFDELPVRDVVSWNSLIAGYAEHGPYDEALKCFEKMCSEGIPPDAITFVCTLKACGSIGSIVKGREIHKEIVKSGLQKDPFVGTTLVDMYAKCGSFLEAQGVFDEMLVRNVASWNALIAGYAEHGLGQEALKCYEQMQLEGIPPDAVTLVCALKACGRTGALEKGREIHIQAAFKGFEVDPFVRNILIDMYARCGALLEARRVFDKLLMRDLISWNALIAGYAEWGPAWEALNCFDLMQHEDISPDARTFVSALKACTSIRAINKGREIHAEIVQRGLETELVIGSSLVDMYSKCGLLAEGQELFDRLPVRDVVLWNTLIAGYAEHGPGQEALKCFEQMQLEDVSPDFITIACILKACGSIGAKDRAREIHTESKLKGAERDILVSNALVDMYAKCGSVSEACEAFHKLPFRDVVSWTALIAGYAEHGPVQEALKCFEQMLLEGISSDSVTCLSVLKGCGRIGALKKGQEIHAHIINMGLERDLSVGNTLIDFYAKCGSLSEARKVFDKMPDRNFVSWDAMINGYGMNNKGKMAMQCFEDMQKERVKPTAITFTCILTACSRASLALKGEEYFMLMREEHGIVSTIDHCTCMVDLLGRSGRLHEAEKFLETMPYLPSTEMWTALLSACKTYGQAELGLRCFQQLVQMDPQNTVPYVHLANIYANAGRRDDAFQIEELRKLAGAKKKPASALIEVNNKVHEFMVGQNPGEKISSMLKRLNSRMEEEGHSPNVDLVLRPLSDEGKESALCEHAEKLALAFGLLNTPPGQVLRVTKNMRMCNNCHDANKVISKIEKREIIVRDSYCVHHFKNGLCSCGALF